MIHKYKKFLKSSNESLELEYNTPFDIFYEKRESLKFIDDVCHVLDDLNDSGVGTFDYSKGYALLFGPPYNGWFTMDQSYLVHHNHDLNSMVSVESYAAGLNDRDIKFIVDCVVFKKLHIEFPDFGPKKYFMKGEIWKPIELSGVISQIEDHYQNVKKWHDSAKNFLESLQRITRMDENIIVFQDGYNLDKFSIIFA